MHESIGNKLLRLSSVSCIGKVPKCPKVSSFSNLHQSIGELYMQAHYGVLTIGFILYSVSPTCIRVLADF